MSDIVARLRSVSQYVHHPNRWEHEAMVCAADEIERLRVELSDIREQFDNQEQQHCDEKRGIYKIINEQQTKIERLQQERNETIKIARSICESEDYPNNWPDDLHLADVLEKRIFNQCVR